MGGKPSVTCDLAFAAALLDPSWTAAAAVVATTAAALLAATALLAAMLPGRAACCFAAAGAAGGIFCLLAAAVLLLLAVGCLAKGALGPYTSSAVTADAGFAAAASAGTTTGPFCNTDGVRSNRRAAAC
jgi:hypothetical protein